MATKYQSVIINFTATPQADLKYDLSAWDKACITQLAGLFKEGWRVAHSFFSADHSHQAFVLYYEQGEA